MKRLLVIPLCFIVFMLCTAESCKEKKANKVVQKLLSTWTINKLEVDGKSKIDPTTTDAAMIKSLRVDFDKYIAQHGDLFWFATYGDDSQEQFDGRYEVSSDSKTLAVTIYLGAVGGIKIIPDLETKTYLLFSSETGDIEDEEFIIQGEYAKDKKILLEGIKF